MHPLTSAIWKGTTAVVLIAIPLCQADAAPAKDTKPAAAKKVAPKPAATPSPPKLDAEALRKRQAGRDKHGRCATFTDGDGSYTSQSEWTGSCVDGYRDGLGQERRTYVRGDYRSVTVSEVSYVRGYKFGLSCVLSDATTSGGKSVTGYREQGTCDLPGQPGSWALRKADHGNWHIGGLTPVKSDPQAERIFFLAGASVESEMERGRQFARDGQSAVKPQWIIGSAMLSDLLPGGTVSYVPDRADLADVAGKRLAIIVSSGTLKEIERWNAGRQAFIAANAYGAFARAPHELPAFLKAGDTAKLVPSILPLIRPLAGSLVMADDLSVLSRGEADYALVFDWRFVGGYLSPEEFAKVKCQTASPSCTSAFSETHAYILIDRKLRARAFGVSSSHPLGGDSYQDLLFTLNQDRWKLDGSWFGVSLQGALLYEMSPEHARQAGDRMRTGNGTAIDEDSAVRAYQQAGGNGDVPAMYQLALYYERKSKGPSRWDSEVTAWRNSAVEWYQKAAGEGHAAAVARLNELTSTR